MMEHENGSFYVCGSSRNVPEDIYNAMKEVTNHPDFDPFRIHFYGSRGDASCCLVGCVGCANATPL